MTITGLSQDNFLINNPIRIEAINLTAGTAYLEVLVTDITDPANTLTSQALRIYPYQGKLRYNLQEVIKGNFPSPEHPTNPAEGQIITTNYRRFTISIMEIIVTGVQRIGYRGRRGAEPYSKTTGATATFTKTFIRGGRKTQLTNQTVTRSEILSPINEIPRWAGFPIATYTLNTSGQITYSAVVTGAEQRRVLGCDPVYVRFLNSLGGYSFWLFETIEERTKGKSGPHTESLHPIHTGFQIDRTIEAETRVHKRHSELIEDLMKSPEVYVYNKYGVEWARVILGDNEHRINNYETVQRIALTFQILNTETPSVTW